jgi:hypothetical protein
MVILVGLGFVVIGAGIAAAALWRCEEPVELFVTGAAIAIVGGFVLVGQLFWRLFT